MENPPTPKMGRPPIEIDWTEFDVLCRMHATLKEIAYFFGCHPDTIAVRVKEEKGMTFPEYYETVSVGGRLSLRRRMWSHAIQKDNPEMQRFLSKQPESKGGLGFSDKVTNEIETGTGTYEKMMGIIDRLEKKKADEK